MSETIQRSLNKIAQCFGLGRTFYRLHKSTNKYYVFLNQALHDRSCNNVFFEFHHFYTACMTKTKESVSISMTFHIENHTDASDYISDCLTIKDTHSKMDNTRMLCPFQPNNYNGIFILTFC